MGRYVRKKYKTRRKRRDVDEVFEDMSSAKTIEKLKNQELDEDRTGMGQYYCVHCSRYFQDNKALGSHMRTKVHKRRLKELKQRPYTTLEAQAASGYNLEEFAQKTEQYKAAEPGRQQMVAALLSNQLQENDEKDKARYAELFPEEAAAKAEVKTEAMATD